jgi:hypothetical protein
MAGGRPAIRADRLIHRVSVPTLHTSPSGWSVWSGTPEEASRGSHLWSAETNCRESAEVDQKHPERGERLPRLARLGRNRARSARTCGPSASSRQWGPADARLAESEHVGRGAAWSPAPRGPGTSRSARRWAGRSLNALSVSRDRIAAKTTSIAGHHRNSWRSPVGAAVAAPGNCARAFPGKADVLSCRIDGGLNAGRMLHGVAGRWPDYRRIPCPAVCLGSDLGQPAVSVREAASCPRGCF